ncbi:3,4-dioxygenase subunit beta [Nocardioides litoris]|uniref:dioxygenase family protein n=1 Tax=Nocardioides litoris TaxID=1926648 RepID=UPI00111FF172|nr:3,4-dioxygenase subunit beta [Nocardioides litoris]
MSSHGHPEQQPTHAVEEHDLGLAHDLGRLSRQRRSWGRRGLLGLLGGVGATALVGCAGGSDTQAASTSTSQGAPPAGVPGGAESGVEVADGEIPEETAGPYPGDGSNGPDVLSESGVVRSDITASFGGSTGVAEGVPVTVRMKVYDLAGEEATPLAGSALYLWHCDRDGRYSMYDDEVADQNYLRGVQEADADGYLSFTTIFPACYDGRWPHMHFEVYPSLEEATSAENKLRTSQLAIPAATCQEVYGVAEGYDSSAETFASVSLDTDMVFSDGWSLQLATVTGSVDEGYVFVLDVPV